MNARHRRAQPCPVTPPVRRSAAAVCGGRSSASPGRCEAFAQTPSGPRDGSEGGRRKPSETTLLVDLARITLCATAAAASELPARQADTDGGDLAVNSVVLSHLLRPVGSALPESRRAGSGFALSRAPWVQRSGVGPASSRDQRAWAVGSRGTDPLGDLRRILAGRWSARRRRPQRTGINPDAGTAAISWSLGPSARGFDGRRMRSRRDARCGRRSVQRVSRGRSPAVYESRY